MRVSKYIKIYILFFILFSGCIEPFSPEIDESEEQIVIEGQITDKEGDHYVRITHTAIYSDPEKKPVTDCHVEVIDNYGNTFEFYESEPGVYKQWLPDDFLNTGTSYKLIVRTPEGTEYESDFNELLYSSPPIDSVYYEIESREGSDPANPLHGLQFYLDFSAPLDAGRNYRWELEETWEYKATYRIQYYYDGTAIIPFDEPFSLMHCWKTQAVPELFTSTTKNSNSNSIIKFPLHYVANTGNKLKIKYSLLVKQYALSDAAFKYWHMVQEQSQERGGLYESQPANLSGNIYNPNDPDEEVLGYFEVSSVTEKRIFVSESFRFRIYDAKCYLQFVNSVWQLRKYNTFPVYMISFSDMGTGPPYGVGLGICFDCTSVGGVTKKPDFW